MPYDFHLLDVMSDFVRADHRNNIFILPKMTRREVDLTIGEILVEILDDYLYYTFG